jgi:hypothetical protein
MNSWEFMGIYVNLYGLCGCPVVRQCAAVCGSVQQCERQSVAVCAQYVRPWAAVRLVVFIWQCTRKCAAVRQCGSMRVAAMHAAVCGSPRGSVRQCVAVRAAVCGSAFDSVWQCAWQCATVLQCGSVRQCSSVWQCGGVRQCGSVRQSGSVLQCGR